jgi:hypothetical protein
MYKKLLIGLLLVCGIQLNASEGKSPIVRWKDRTKDVS